jgi:hypothetical protein
MKIFRIASPVPLISFVPCISIGGCDGNHQTGAALGLIAWKLPNDLCQSRGARSRVDSRREQAGNSSQIRDIDTIRDGAPNRFG